YAPGTNCINSLIKPEDTMLKDRTLKEFIDLFNLQKYYPLSESEESNTSSSSPEETNKGQDAGKCGDGICDNIEKSSGMCLTDCK
ncbi:MAG: hypothetical protein WCO18_00940, partial [bacterium]